jgi:hypothetical protein
MRPCVVLLLLVLAARAAADDVALLEGVVLERVPAAERADLLRVTRDPTVDTEVTGGVRCRQPVYEFLLQRLPFAARAIDALELEESGRYTIEADGPEGFRIDDRAGATADCVRAWESPGLQVVIARGQLDMPVLPTVLGTGVIVTRYAPSADDPTRLDARCRVLFKLSNRFLHALTSPVRKALGKVLEDKLRLLVRSATVLAEAVERDPTGVLAALEEAKTLPQDELRAFREAVLLH